MSKRRISTDKAAEIGKERSLILAELSINAARNGNDVRARRYVSLAVRICQKTKANMPPGFRYCKGCFMPMIPGSTSRIRLDNRRISCTCLRCGRIYRIPHSKEMRL